MVDVLKLLGAGLVIYGGVKLGQQLTQDTAGFRDSTVSCTTGASSFCKGAWQGGKEAMAFDKAYKQAHKYNDSLPVAKKTKAKGGV